MILCLPFLPTIGFDLVPYHCLFFNQSLTLASSWPGIVSADLLVWLWLASWAQLYLLCCLSVSSATDHSLSKPHFQPSVCPSVLANCLLVYLFPAPCLQKGASVDWTSGTPIILSPLTPYAKFLGCLDQRCKGIPLVIFASKKVCDKFAVTVLVFADAELPYCWPTSIKLF